MAKRKVKTYSAEELLNMSKEQVIEIYNREAERRNKQITRARNRGITPAATGKRKTRLSKKTRISKEEIIRRYQETKAEGDVTIEGLVSDLAQMFGNQSPAFKAQLNQLLKEAPGKFSAIYAAYKKLMVGIQTGQFANWRQIYYDTLKYAVETKHDAKGYTDSEKRGTIWDSPREGDADILKKYRELLGDELLFMLERIINK